MTARKGPPLGAGILQNADVAERLNVWPAGRALGGGQMDTGQAWVLFGCLGSLLPSAPAAIPGLLEAGSVRPGGGGTRAWGTAASITSPDQGTAPHGELASASPVKAYCCPVSKMTNVTERSGGPRTLAQNF